MPFPYFSQLQKGRKLLSLVSRYLVSMVQPILRVILQGKWKQMCEQNNHPASTGAHVIKIAKTIKVKLSGVLVLCALSEVI
jgi:hypothetical protein